MTKAVGELESCFRQIQQQRMRDMPILNKALQVAAVGFHPWREFWMGVLITPWFANLVLLPAAAGAGTLPAPGSSASFAFPAGRFTFISAREAGIGTFLSCSLLSPVFELRTQQQAEEMAREAIRTIMRSHTANRSDNGTHDAVPDKISRRRFLARLAASDTDAAATADKRSDRL
ncbi:[NiFe]-hydrogenase assembly chaperone HybE [Exilibacterium tricleocarpae]|nr:[NiFe]-hydrogenase assembly chaperone HybE [Exilibacterium tricleocarpae]